MFLKKALLFIEGWCLIMELSNEIYITDFISIISVTIALIFGIISIRQNSKQIEISNKQSLFDKRYKIYLLLQHMDHLCNNNLELIDENNSLILSDFIAACITNSVHFYHLCDIFDKNKKDTCQTEFLSLIEELKDYGLQAQLLFPKEYAAFISSYFNYYTDLLSDIYKYSRALDYTKNELDKIPEANKQNVDYMQILSNNISVNNIEINIKKCKESLLELHNIYNDKIESLTKYLTLAEKIDMHENKRQPSIVE